MTLACKQAYPDVEVFGRYDTFWQPSSMADLRGQVGVSLNLPIYRGKLNAAVNEAMFRLNQRKAEYEARVLDIQYEVRSAYERLEESRQTVRLYAERMLPAATQNVAAARANYDVGKTTFLGLAEAQRQLFELREKQEQAIAEDHRRLAELERVLAGVSDVRQIEFAVRRKKRRCPASETPPFAFNRRVRFRKGRSPGLTSWHRSRRPSQSPCRRPCRQRPCSVACWPWPFQLCLAVVAAELNADAVHLDGGFRVEGLARERAFHFFVLTAGHQLLIGLGGELLRVGFELRSGNCRSRNRLGPSL